MTKKTVVWRSSGNFLVFVHSNEAPAQDEWNQILAILRSRNQQSAVRILVYTAGGAPNARQRSELHRVLSRDRALVAVLTPSAVARAAGTALSWFNPSVRIMGATEIDAALDHLDATLVDRRFAKAALEELRAELNLAAG